MSDSTDSDFSADAAALQRRQLFRREERIEEEAIDPELLGDQEARADVASLRTKDSKFLMRLTLRVGVAILFGFWAFLKMQEADIGGCAARAFGTVTTGEPTIVAPE